MVTEISDSSQKIEYKKPINKWEKKVLLISEVKIKQHWDSTHQTGNHEENKYNTTDCW